jgi:hypothetical protein
MKLDITPFNPCGEGIEYYESKQSSEEACNDCERGDWMLWIAAKLPIDDRVLTKAKALCANTVRHLMKDKRSTDAVDAALRYADGKINREELDKYAIEADKAVALAAVDVDHANYASTIVAAVAAAIASTAAAAHADAVAVHAAHAAHAAHAYNADVRDAHNAGYIAATANRRQTADICREILTEAVFEKINQTNNTKITKIMNERVRKLVTLLTEQTSKRKVAWKMKDNGHKCLTDLTDGITIMSYGGCYKDVKYYTFAIYDNDMGTVVGVVSETANENDEDKANYLMLQNLHSCAVASGDEYLNKEILDRLFRKLGVNES